MIYWKIFLANFIANLLGYGGGPATIPLLEHEVVDRYSWYTTGEYSEMVALGNGLPGPIATKLAGYIGYDQGGLLGAAIGLFASVAPSLIMMIALLGLLLKFKESKKVKRLTQFVRPTIAVLLGVMTYHFFFDSYVSTGIMHTAIIGVLGLIFLEKLHISPVYVVLGALVYGAVFL
ncbi:chromate transporter [Virgibacillus alimentarius]|uniref:Chromate transporter n=1 Tax=Virgibacillus alimentarius TaxID=698769 RepID=A0ABS4S5J1_9BACI|nr:MULTISPECIES: chromate transporter [Virgibacillus]MBP2256750.1 chromate transporter [Virgibacillus alimentarius]HLR65619.1 chromate transporter [Virgibacillus sp.]